MTATMKVTNLQNESSATPNIVLNADGTTTIPTQSTTNLTLSGTLNVGGGNISPQTGFKNRIINGAMTIDQRNAGASISISDNQDKYPVDRFFVANRTGTGVFSGQQSTTAPAGFKNALIVTTTTANASLSASQYGAIRQNIEGFNVSDLGWGTASAQPVTISFWVRSSLTGTFGASIVNGGFTRSYPFTYTIAAANTYEYKSVTIPGDTSGTWATDSTAGVNIFFGLGAGTSVSGAAGSWAGTFYYSATGATSVVGTNGATFYITGVQLEKGSTATPFEFRSIGQELALCQRYAIGWNYRPCLVAIGQAGLYSDANTISMAAYGVNVTGMRIVPTSITTYGTQGTDWVVQTAPGGNQTGFTLSMAIGAIIASKTSHGISTGCNLQILTTSGNIVLSSEL